MTDYRLKTSQLFSEYLDNAHLCLSYDVTSPFLPRRQLDVHAIEKIDRKIKIDCNELVQGIIQVSRERRLVKNENGIYTLIKKEDPFDENQEHRYNIGLRDSVCFDERCNNKDFLAISKEFVRSIGLEVADWEIHGLPMLMGNTLVDFLRGQRA